MKILIIGATRGIGRELVRQAIEAGHEVTVLVRDPEKPKLKVEKLNILKGDILDKTSVEHAVAGQNAICTTIGIAPTFKHVSVFSKGAKNVVEAMNISGVRRLLAVTGIGAGDSKGHGGFFYDKIINPIFLGKIYADKNREEKIITDSGLDWIVIRPGFLTNGKKTGNYRVLTDLKDVKAGKISRADVADFILRNLESDEFLRQTPVLTY